MRPLFWFLSFFLFLLGLGGATREKDLVEVFSRWPKPPVEEIVLGGGVKMKFVQIPSGTFFMGEPPVAGQENPEADYHQITLTKGFFMGIHEVTQAQYQKIMGTNPSDFVAHKGIYPERYNDYSNHPVEAVTWFEAVRFCNALSVQQGLPACYRNQKNSITIVDYDPVFCDWNAPGYRLPTSAEWEYACRAGTSEAFYWGRSDDESSVKDFCWYALNCHEKEWTSPHAKFPGTQPVGTKLPNSWGLYDMGGNVFEWCFDWGRRANRKPGSSIDPRGPPSSDKLGWKASRVMRGGDWRSFPEELRSACDGGCDFLGRPDPDNPPEDWGTDGGSPDGIDPFTEGDRPNESDDHPPVETPDQRYKFGNCPTYIGFRVVRTIP